MSDPTPAPGAQLPPEERPGEDDWTFVVSVASILIGGTALAMGLLMRAAIQFADVPTASIMEYQKIILAIGAGLLVLGVSLQAGNLVDLFRQRRSLHGLNAGASVLLALVLLVLINYVFARHNLWRWDLTQEGRFTLTEESRQLVRTLPKGKRLRLTFIQSASTAAMSGWEVETLDALLSQYDDASPRLAVERVDPNQMDRQQLQAFLERMDLGARDYRDLLGVVVESGYEGQEGWVRTRHKQVSWDELWDVPPGPPGERSRPTFVGEQKLSAAIREVVDPDEPKLYVLTGHQELSIDEFDRQRGLSALAQILRGKGYDVAALNLAEQPKYAVPEDADLIVIPAPGMALADFEVKSLEAWLGRGGDAIVLFEPVEDALSGAPLAVGLEELLAREYGVEVAEKQLYMQGYDPLTQQVLVTPQVFIEGLSGSGHPVVDEIQKYGAARLTFFDPRPLVTVPGKKGVTVTALVDTPDGRRGESYFAATDPERQATWEEGPFTLAVAVSKPRPELAPKAEGDEGDEGDEDAGAEAPAPETRLLVLGDADWVSNGMVARPDNLNLELMQNAVAWALDREEKIIGKATRPKSYQLHMEPDQLAFLQLSSLFGLPLVAVGLGVFAFMIRRR